MGLSPARESEIYRKLSEPGRSDSRAIWVDGWKITPFYQYPNYDRKTEYISEKYGETNIYFTVREFDRIFEGEQVAIAKRFQKKLVERVKALADYQQYQGRGYW